MIKTKYWPEGDDKDMAKYRISVSFDEKNFFWIITQDGRIINRSPTKEGLIGVMIRSYNKANVCPICREEYERNGKELTDKSILYPGNAKREKDKNGKETGRWICVRHKSKYYNDMPDSYDNIKKSIIFRRKNVCQLWK